MTPYHCKDIVYLQFFHIHLYLVDLANKLYRNVLSPLNMKRDIKDEKNRSDFRARLVRSNTNIGSQVEKDKN